MRTFLLICTCILLSGTRDIFAATRKLQLGAGAGYYNPDAGLLPGISGSTRFLTLSHRINKRWSLQGRYQMGTYYQQSFSKRFQMADMDMGLLVSRSFFKKGQLSFATGISYGVHDWLEEVIRDQEGNWLRCIITENDIDVFKRRYKLFSIPLKLDLRLYQAGRFGVHLEAGTFLDKEENSMMLNRIYFAPVLKMGL